MGENIQENFLKEEFECFNITDIQILSDNKTNFKQIITNQSVVTFQNIPENSNIQIG